MTETIEIPLKEYCDLITVTKNAREIIEAIEKKSKQLGVEFIDEFTGFRKVNHDINKVIADSTLMTLNAKNIQKLIRGIDNDEKKRETKS